MKSERRVPNYGGYKLIHIMREILTMCHSLNLHVSYHTSPYLNKDIYWLCVFIIKYILCQLLTLTYDIISAYPNDILTLSLLDSAWFNGGKANFYAYFAANRGEWSKLMMVCYVPFT